MIIKQQQYSPSEVLISSREPYNKSTLWIQPFKDHSELKLYNEGWKTLFSTKDEGLSEVAKKEVEKYNNELKELLISLLQKQINKLSNDVLLLTNKNIELEKRIKKLEYGIS